VADFTNAGWMMPLHPTNIIMALEKWTFHTMHKNYRTLYKTAANTVSGYFWTSQLEQSMFI